MKTEGQSQVLRLLLDAEPNGSGDLSWLPTEVTTIRVRGKQNAT